MGRSMRFGKGALDAAYQAGAGSRGKPVREHGKKVNKFVNVCSQLMHLGVSIKGLAKVIDSFAKDKRNKLIDQERFLIQVRNSGYFNNVGMPDHKSNSYNYDEWAKIESGIKATSHMYIDQKFGMLHYGELFERYELEMVKVNQMERLFIQIRQRMDKHNCSLREVLKNYKVTIEDGKMLDSEFYQMAERLGAIRSRHKEDRTALLDEYGPEEEKQPHQEKEEDDDPLQEHEKKKEEKPVYFDVREFEQDFDFYERSIIPQIDKEVYKHIEHVIDSGTKFGHFFLKRSSGATPGGAKDDRQINSNKDGELEYQPELHAYDIYDFVEEVQQLYESYRPPLLRNVQPLYSIFVMKTANQDKLIPFNYIYTLYHKNTASLRIDSSLKEEILKENQKALINHISVIAAVKEVKNLETYFGSQRSPMTVPEMVSVLIKEPFDLNSVQLNEYVCKQVLLEFYTRQRSEREPIDLAYLMKEVSYKQSEQRQLDDLIVKFNTCLIKNGLTFEMVFEKIMGFRIVKEAEMTKSQLQLCFKLLEFAITEEDFRALFDFFRAGKKDKISVDRFKKESEKLKSGKLLENAKKTQQMAISRSLRRFNSSLETERFIARVLEEQKLDYVGPLLKGQDFNDDGTITRDNFFRTISSIQALAHPDFGLKEGDILDLMNKYDRDKTGMISLNRVKDELSRHFRTYFTLRLQSNIKEMFNEDIVERTEQKKFNMPEKEVGKPRLLFHHTFDFFCGIRVHGKNEEEFLKGICSNVPMKLNAMDFYEAMRVLRVDILSSECQQLFKYFLDQHIRNLIARQNEKSQPDLDFSLEQETKTEYLRVQDLLDQMYQVVPFAGNYRKVEEKLLQTIVESLSETQTPLMDVLDAFRLTFNSGMADNASNVLTKDFEEKILQDYLKLDAVITHNQVRLLSQRYENYNTPQYIDIDNFTGDLFRECDYLNEEQGKAKFKIFRTKEEAEDEQFFQL